MSSWNCSKIVSVKLDNGKEYEVDDDCLRRYLETRDFEEAAKLFGGLPSATLRSIVTALQTIQREDKSKTQSSNASQPRGKIISDDGDGETIGEIIGGLALSYEHQNDFAIEIWMPFFSELRHRHLNPKEVDHPIDQKKSYIEYDQANGKRKQITFGQFANIVSDYRTGKK